MAHFSEDGVRKVIQNIVNEAGSQRLGAEKLGVSPQYVSDILRGRREVGAGLAKKLGLHRKVIFEFTKGFKA